MYADLKDKMKIEEQGFHRIRKSRKFFEEHTHIRERPLSTINITNSGERG